jgi:hypothetical protein
MKMKGQPWFEFGLCKPLLPLFLALLLPFVVSAEFNDGRIQQAQAAAQKNPASVAQSHSGSRFACLPEGFQLGDKISEGDVASLANHSSTLEAYLVKLRARCKRGKLFDAKGKEIRLFRYSCFGNRPENYKEIVQKESEELARLKRRYRVLTIACDRKLH